MFFLFVGSFFLADGWSATWCHMWALSVLFEYSRKLHSSRRWSGYGDAFYYQGKARELNYKWRANRFLHVNYFETWGLLQWRAACLSIASKIYSQLTFFHKDSESTKRSGSTCIASRTSSSSPISLDLKIFCKHKERGAKDVEMRKLQNLKSQTCLQN